MNATEIKTRLGLILQELTAKALGLTGYTYVENHQYDEISEVPDFLIPDAENPHFMIEVHQTDARDSFRMKVLRAFTAVTESKVHYGDNLISVNILFGDPQRELPESNVKALCGFFDVNLVPRYSEIFRAKIEQLESLSLKFAATEGPTVSEAAEQVANKCPTELDEFSNLLSETLVSGRSRKELKRLWQLERKRTQKLGPPPSKGEQTYHKRNILRSLFFSDSQFEELISKNDPSEYSPELCDQLVLCKLAEREEQIWGDEIVIDPIFLGFLRNPDAYKFRQLCQERLNDNEEMKWFFEDIRNTDRRKKMCSYFLSQLKNDYSSLKNIIFNDLRHDKGNFPVSHKRCWIADLLPIIFDKSHNEFNRLMYQHHKYTINLGNPFNNIVIKSDRLGNNNQTYNILSEVLNSVFINQTEESNIDISCISILDLQSKLLEFRVDAAIKLQKLNPVYLVIESICRVLGLTYYYEGTCSIVSDLANAARGVGKFNLYHIHDDSKVKKVIAIAVSVIDQNGDHKSKEWGARRRALGYRYIEGKIVPAEFDEALFIIDGDWEYKHVERLHRSGWTRIIRLDQIEENLRDIFGVEELTPIEIPELEPLPMAAEDEKDIQIDKQNGMGKNSK